MDFLATPMRRRLLFGALYMSEGAPIGFIWWYLPTHLRAAGVPIEKITALTAAMVLPWTFKFMWAPLVDSLRARGWTLRGWIIVAQTLMGLCLLPLLWLDPLVHLAAYTSLLFVHAIAASTQDVAIDALAIGVTSLHERGAINGWMQTGMLFGRSVFGGAALVAVTHVGHAGIVVALIVAIWSTLALVLASREPAIPEGGDGFWPTLRQAVSLRSTWLGLGFALLGGAGFEAVGAVAGPFMIDLGHDRASVGRFLGIVAVAAMLVGALAGGYLSDRMGRRRSTTVFLLLIAASVAGVAIASHVAPGSITYFLGGVYLAIGLFTAASYALFMDLTHPRLGATQFSTFMAATNGCESWSTFSVGRLTARVGYPFAFGVMAALSLLALPLLRGMHAPVRSRTDEAPADAGRPPERSVEPLG